jgi:hypothetical protein
MPRNTSQQASDPRPKEVELEECTQLFFKYSVIIQEQVDAMRHLPKEVAAAHAQVTEEHHERQKHALQRELTLEELQNTLSYYGGLCEKEPQTLLELS